MRSRRTVRSVTRKRTVAVLRPGMPVLRSLAQTRSWGVPMAANSSRLRGTLLSGCGAARAREARRQAAPGDLHGDIAAFPALGSKGIKENQGIPAEGGPFAVS